MSNPDWGMDARASMEAKASMDGALGQFGMELEYLSKSIEHLQQRISPILRNDMLEQVEDPHGPAPSTDLRKMLDRLGSLRVGLDRITDRVDL